MKKKLIVIYFVLLYLFGMIFIPNVNSDFDEMIEQNILRSNIRQYASFARLESFDQYFQRQGIEKIGDSIEKDHGVSPYYVFSILLFIKYINPAYVSVLWHIYTFTIFYISIIFLFKLMKYLFKKDTIAILTTALYYFSPRIFIDSLHNNKDMVLMSLLVIGIYFGTKFILERKNKDALLFGVIMGFVCNIKIIGFLFLGTIGLGYIIKMIIDKQFNKKNFICGLIAALTAIFAFVLLTPAIWGNGSFKIVDYFKYCLDNTVNFRSAITVLFEGVRYNKNINPLPWYYIPKMIGITLPILTVLLIPTSIISISVNIIKNKKIDNNSFIMLCVFVMFLVPLMTAIFSEPNLYNGWRHFYFLYGLIIIMIGYLFNVLQKNDKIRNVMYALVIISTIISGYTIVKYNVANIAYYNSFMPKSGLENKYELDYYGVTTKAAFDKLFQNKDLKLNPDRRINMYGPGFNHRIIQDYLTNTYPTYDGKINYLDDNAYQEAINNKEPVYIICNAVYTYIDTSNYSLVSSYKMYDNHLVDIYLDYRP